MEDDKYTLKRREKTSLLRNLHKQIYTKLINFIATINVSILCDKRPDFQVLQSFVLYLDQTIF